MLKTNENHCMNNHYKIFNTCQIVAFNKIFKLVQPWNSYDFQGEKLTSTPAIASMGYYCYCYCSYS